MTVEEVAINVDGRDAISTFPTVGHARGQDIA
jgi:hypothetical protein